MILLSTDIVVLRHLDLSASISRQFWFPAHAPYADVA
jgi:hypothetical protein